jgi:hypothetical protein
MEQLEKQGAKLLGQVVHLSELCGYCHMSLEGGSVIEANSNITIY